MGGVWLPAMAAQPLGVPPGLDHSGMDNAKMPRPDLPTTLRKPTSPQHYVDRHPHNTTSRLAITLDCSASLLRKLGAYSRTVSLRHFIQAAGISDILQAFLTGGSGHDGQPFRFVVED
jgi:hypothetical protein